jgi:hypothetical protein
VHDGRQERSALIAEAGWHGQTAEMAMMKQHIRMLTRQVEIMTKLVKPLIEERSALVKEVKP